MIKGRPKHAYVGFESYHPGHKDPNMNCSEMEKHQVYIEA